MTSKIKALFCLIFVILSTFSTSSLSAGAESSQIENYAVYPSLNYGSGARAEQLKRGEYLVKLGDCIACHTAPKGGQSFAGGYPVDTPFGTIYSPNITPDKSTGIGKWTLADFNRAMREGISPEKHYYYPAFPFLYFNILTDQDLQDIKAYLDAIPAVNQANKKNELMFPFNWRFLQLGWRTLFFHYQKTGPYVNDVHQSALWNRGNYLVNGLGHCGMCHTPSHYLLSEKYPLAAPKHKYDFTGAMVQGFYAPDISSNFLKNVPLDEFADVFLKDRMIGGGEVVGPMKEANHDSLQYLTFEDIKAIDVYLVSVKSKIPPKKTSTAPGLTQGKEIYEKYCAGCHTTGAGGAPKIGDVVAWNEKMKPGIKTLYTNALNGIGGMPKKGTCINCTTEEIQYAVDYIVSESKLSSEIPATAKVPPLKKLTMADGKHLYEMYCAVCHAPGSNYPNAPTLGDQPAWKPIIKQGMDQLILHTIQGYGHMPPRGGCMKCNDAEIKAAVKYMVQNSQTGRDYRLW